MNMLRMSYAEFLKRNQIDGKPPMAVYVLYQGLRAKALREQKEQTK